MADSGIPRSEVRTSRPGVLTGHQRQRAHKAALAVWLQMVRRCQGQTLIIHIIYALLQIWITSKMWPMDLRGLDGYESALEKGRESAEALGTYIDLWVFFSCPALWCYVCAGISLCTTRPWCCIRIHRDLPRSGRTLTFTSNPLFVPLSLGT